MSRRTGKRSSTPARRGSRVQGPDPDGDESAASVGGARVRPGRRTVQERQEAVLQLLSGKATVDQIAARLGVRPETVEGWRQDAVDGMAESLRRGSGKSPREVELERENRELREVITETAIAKALLEQALKKERDSRPFGGKKSRK